MPELGSTDAEDGSIALEVADGSIAPVAEVPGSMAVVVVADGSTAGQVVEDGSTGGERRPACPIRI